MRILAGLVVAIALLALGFVGGRWWNQEAAATNRVALAAPAEGARGAQTLASTSAIDQAARLVPAFAAAVSERDWPTVVDLLEAARLENRGADFDALYAGMRALARELVAADAAADAGLLLEAYLQLNPQDYELRFQLAESWLAAGDPQRALKPILEVLAAPLTAELAERAALERDRIVALAAEQIDDRSEPDDLVALHEALLEAEPANEGHRLRLAAAQLEAGSIDAAAATLETVARFSVDADEYAALQEAIRLQRSQLQLERGDRELMASAASVGEGLRMLVDTGATQTALSSDALARIGAQPTGESRRVLTAGGTVVADVYLVAELELGGRRFEDVPVLELSSLPERTDGLLGLDLLQRLGAIGALPGGAEEAFGGAPAPDL
ncbi:MAG: retropepsin-like aspartic protease [Pseudomonadota bacterium]